MIIRQLVRQCISDLDTNGQQAVPSVIQRLKAGGAISGQHVGRIDMESGSTMAVEWYAGQILSILESESWFAVNSLINCVDKFCPLEID